MKIPPIGRMRPVALFRCDTWQPCPVAARLDGAAFRLDRTPRIPFARMGISLEDIVFLDPDDL